MRLRIIVAVSVVLVVVGETPSRIDATQTLLRITCNMRKYGRVNEEEVEYKKTHHPIPVHG